MTNHEERTQYIAAKAKHLVSLCEAPEYNSFSWNQDVISDILAMYRSIGGKVKE